jgi:hypothetical protein
MAIRYDAVTKPRNETPDVTKPVTKLAHEISHEIPTKLSGGGRPPAGAVAMTGAERVRKYRARRRGAVAAS